MSLRALGVVGVLVGIHAAAAEPPFVPAAPEKIPKYSAEIMPCKIDRDDRTRVTCKGDLLENKTLRELSILRNTIYARYGWDGYRKPWLRDYFHAQPWFKANPKFTYKVLSEADKKNAHFVAVREQSFTDVDLRTMRDDVLARRGKVWNDKPVWKVGDKSVRACKKPKGAPSDVDADKDPLDSKDCHYQQQKWYRAEPSFQDSQLDADDKIELGLIDRSSGSFALDDETRGKSEASLDRILAPAELRQLSLRDLRLLRNTIYAKKGRPFKSQILRDHFTGMSWYQVNEGYTDKLLSANDVRNIAMIKSVENEFGGPLSDEDWLTEPAVDGA